MRLTGLLAPILVFGLVAACKGGDGADRRGSVSNGSGDMVAEESGDVVKQDVEIVAGDAATAGGGAAGGSVETGPPVITYSGFGGTNLVAGNPSNEPAGTDRLRIKTYPALMEEFDRVFGNVPDELTNNASTFAMDFNVCSAFVLNSGVMRFLRLNSKW